MFPDRGRAFKLSSASQLDLFISQVVFSYKLALDQDSDSCFRNGINYTLSWVFRVSLEWLKHIKSLDARI